MTSFKISDFLPHVIDDDHIRHFPDPQKPEVTFDFRKNFLGQVFGGDAPKKRRFFSTNFPTCPIKIVGFRVKFWTIL